MHVFKVRNVNEAIDELRNSVSSSFLSSASAMRWESRSSRNGPVIEVDCPVATVYERPWERVSFSRARDANPFFHFFESIWIMAGRDDVAFLALFNKKMQEYSDHGTVFHAPYGYRMRRSVTRQIAQDDGTVKFERLDQIKKVAAMLKADPNTRRAAISIWDAASDLGTNSKDIPCNDMVFFKARACDKGWMLDMTVMCRSNDAIWGAYGANAVQFSVLQEVIAGSIGMMVGSYTQVSDSFHVYTDNDAWRRIMSQHDWKCDPYQSHRVYPFPLMNESPLDEWLEQAEALCEDIMRATLLDEAHYEDAFFRRVAFPMWKAWWHYKTQNLSAAVDFLETQDLEIDWLCAAMYWLLRRAQK